MAKSKSLKQIVKELESINDSQEDIIWEDLKHCLDRVKGMTVEEWLRQIHNTNSDFVEERKPIKFKQPDCFHKAIDRRHCTFFDKSCKDVLAGKEGLCCPVIDKDKAVAALKRHSETQKVLNKDW